MIAARADEEPAEIDPDRSDPGLGTGPRAVQTLWERVAALRNERREQERLNRELLARISALELWTRRHVEDTAELELPDNETFDHSDRLDRLDDQLREQTEQLQLVHGKLDVILDVLQSRS